MSVPVPSDAQAPTSKGRISHGRSGGCAESIPGIPTAKPEKLAARFRPLFVVGRGGMGSVEVALESLEGAEGHVVALKRMLPKAVLDKRQTEMFLREAKLASLLVHPNVVRATAFGEIDGELFLVMEYVEGEPLSSVVSRAHEREGSLALPFVLHVLAEICEGLHAAHELTDDSGRPLNVVHRDVSPHNVMVAYEGQIKLLDFGVAKIEAIDAEGRTKTGEVKGKTSYMSPEQAMGDEIDRRSDLYSVGAVLFEAVSGRKMWGGGTDLEVIRRLALEEPPSLEEAAPGTPAVICELQRRLVARDPAKRPATALEVANELRAAIAGSAGGGSRPDSKVVGALMTRLFADEIESRHATLRAAIAEAKAGAPPWSPSHALQPPTDATPVPATTRANLSPAGQKRTRGLLLVASGVILAATAGGVLWRRNEPSAPAVTPVTVASTAASPSSPASGTTRVVPTESPKALVESPPPAAELGPTAVATSPSPAPRVVVKPAEAVKPATTLKVGGAKPRPATSSKPTAPLDVDPTPF
jgi:hypothetical protein